MFLKASLFLGELPVQSSHPVGGLSSYADAVSVDCGHMSKAVLVYGGKKTTSIEFFCYIVTGYYYNYLKKYMDFFYLFVPPDSK